jgi:hypothetical protein
VESRLIKTKIEVLFAHNFWQEVAFSSISRELDALEGWAGNPYWRGWFSTIDSQRLDVGCPVRQAGGGLYVGARAGGRIEPPVESSDNLDGPGGAGQRPHGVLADLVAKVIKHFGPSLMLWRNKLERLYLESYFGLGWSLPWRSIS